MDEIEKVQELQNEYLKISKNNLGETWSLTQDLHDLYDCLAELLKGTRKKLPDEILVILNFFFGSRYQLIIGSISVLNGNLSDSYHFTRKAIELYAFASRVEKHPHLSTIWIKAGNSDEAYKEYREKFRPGRLFPQDHKILGELYQRYDQFSKLCHSSVVSLSQNIKIEATEDSIKTEFSCFGVREGDHSELGYRQRWVERFTKSDITFGQYVDIDGEGAMRLS